MLNNTNNLFYKIKNPTPLHFSSLSSVGFKRNKISRTKGREERR